MTRKQAIIVSIICVLLFAFILKINQCMQYRNQAQFSRLATPFEFQQQLRDLGFYSGEIDGVFGPETMRAWQEAIAEQSSKEIKKRMQKADGR
jgi:hypothetical protein